MRRLAGKLAVILAAAVESDLRPPPSSPPKARQSTSLDHIEANLSEPMTLPDLAAAGGLSRMHFASQFRTATGLRPHAFVMRRRIERVQELLRDSALPLVEVALSRIPDAGALHHRVPRAGSGDAGRWRKLRLN